MHFETSFENEKLPGAAQEEQEEEEQEEQEEEEEEQEYEEEGAEGELGGRECEVGWWLAKAGTVKIYLPPCPQIHIQPKFAFAFFTFYFTNLSTRIMGMYDNLL